MFMRRMVCVGLTLTASLLLAVPSLRGQDLQRPIPPPGPWLAPVLIANAGVSGRPDLGLIDNLFATSISSSTARTENAGFIWGGDFDVHSLPNAGAVALLLAGWACILMIHRHYRKGS